MIYTLNIKCVGGAYLEEPFERTIEVSENDSGHAARYDSGADRIRQRSSVHVFHGTRSERTTNQHSRNGLMGRGAGPSLRDAALRSIPC